MVGCLSMNGPEVEACPGCNPAFAQGQLGPAAAGEQDGWNSETAFSYCMHCGVAPVITCGTAVSQICLPALST